MRAAHLSKIDLDLLRAFDALMNERSVTRAAEQLGMTQSGLSHALGRLRDAFHDDLLVRSGPQMVPTARALELHDAVRGMLEILEQKIMPVARFDPAVSQRQFTTAMSDMAEVVALPPLMARMQEAAPGCTLRNRRLPNPELTSALESGVVELAVGNVFEPSANIYQQTMYRHDYAVLACALNTRLSPRLTLAEYLALPHVVATIGADEHLEQTALGPRGLQRHIALVVGGTMSIPWILPGTELIATVPSHLARLVRGVLPIQVHSLPLDAPPFAIKTYWHPRSQTDPGHRWFRELVFEVMHDYPEWPEAG
ncbi:MAG TPA: LysR family transcriptional regulator [Ramlibacter sp.]|jgi:DNA-binding transcriptional LysR family regulator